MPGPDSGAAGLRGMGLPHLRSPALMVELIRPVPLNR